MCLWRYCCVPSHPIRTAAAIVINTKPPKLLLVAFLVVGFVFEPLVGEPVVLGPVLHRRLNRLPSLSLLPGSATLFTHVISQSKHGSNTAQLMTAKPAWST
jgi:hypothetical protein